MQIGLVIHRNYNFLYETHILIAQNYIEVI